MIPRQALAQFVATANDGNYPFEFTELAPGQYEVYAGSDADNDLLICDAGEACGAWLTLDQPILLDLQGDTTGIDFPIEYQVSLPNLVNSATENTKGDDGGIVKARLQTDD